ncbi:hypothetical protein QYE76_022744 [Lolium multiflorum]|uniref:DUF4218 domain-containing protein n=1 Tax=Lolium multiflorum TaxID=4521 RepID=A0AAD8RA43_LOLMU|nr:hypothetical protein QYE76_022744 [Lolium multiflorum]
MENHYILYLKLDMEDKEVHLKPDMDMEVNLRLDMEVMQGHTMLVESEPQGAGKDTIFAELIEEAKRAASDGGTMSRFSLTVKLLQAKSYYRISNVAFNAILLILALQYPTSSIPKSYEEALSIIGRLGLGYDSIHVCPNNCVLFRKDYAKENNCPKCKASRWKDADGRRQIPEKVLRHFPLIPRLQRMFLSKEQSKEVQWHKLKRQDVENDLSHPADGDAWKDFDNIHKDFAADARNIRLGLATDGFNPYGNMSNSYSMWPVFVVPYNLPPWACMDQSNFMLALLIPGPSSPGKDFDVFMEPLMEELQELWKGVKSYDANSPDKFDLRAAILWCIHDYPALHTLSGRATAGYQACVRCDKENCSKKLRNKICFIGHRRWLPRHHPWRNSKEFDGASESREKPAEFTPEELKQQLDRVRDVIPGKLQKKRKREDGQCWSRRSCLWDLPYWEDLKLRHNLDVMHIEKNICDNLIGTFMNIQGKTKDTVNSRLDLEDMGIRRDLHLQPVSADSFEMPQAWYTMSKQEKIAFCEFIKAVRFPDGYASNISKCVASDKCKLQGLKTHDCHILLQRILPAGLRGTIHEDIYEAVAELGNFFRELCCKTLKRDVLDRLEKEIVVILCKLEKIFPPSFFDVMVHLAIHLPKEARLRGPVHYGWMYPVERRLLTLKRYVRNNARPEGSIAEAYIVDECLTFCSRYFDDVETRFNRPSRNPERDDSHIGDLSVFKHGVKFIGASQYVYAGEDYDNMIGKMRNDVCPDLYALACKPDFRVRLYSACVVDSVRYHTVDREKNRKTQNSGIVSEGDHDGNSIDFFGQLKSIIRLQYNSSGGVHRSVVLFRCDWFDLGGRKPGFDDDGHFKSVNTEKFWCAFICMLPVILRYVRGTLDLGLSLHASAGTDIIAYSDADWAGCPDTRRSTSGYYAYLGLSLISWSSKRQPTVSRSSAEAEYPCRGYSPAMPFFLLAIVPTSENSTTMGKKKGAAGSSASAGAAKVGLDWCASTISNREVNRLRTLGFISSSDSDIRLPGSSSRPKPPKGFTVMFAAYLFRGISLPAHEFLRSLLFFYGIQLWQLTPNSILHLSIFITMCEALLGIDPHWGLWRKIFYVKRYNGNDGPPVIGGVGFVVRKEASTVAQCYPPTPESVVELEDDDDSDETEDGQHALEDSDIPGDKAPEDDARTKAMRRRKINEDLMTIAESSPRGQDDDANVTVSLPPAAKSSTLSKMTWSYDDDEVPLAKRAKLFSGRIELAKELTPSTAEPTPPPRTVVAKVPVSKVNPSVGASTPSTAHDHLIFATVDVVADFADQFTHLESKNAQLRKAIKTSADQVLEANRLTADAQNEKILLKDELKKLKKKMKDEQEARREAAIVADEKEGALRESVSNLLNSFNFFSCRTFSESFS